uniref:ABC transmembrane type-2 domain-containing protein n=1 Tax=Crouania attenuata TaxID=42002 RepID=A0A4D6WNL8_9FLOR|nr:hypothetical protein [Crouania attenuata]
MLTINSLKPCLKVNNNLSLSNYSREIYSLIKRLYIQILKRPTILITSMVQPLLWLILFGALFKEVNISSQYIDIPKIQYIYFLNPGIIIFTTFTGALNAGLPTIFDREFGFLNRLLISPMKSYYSFFISNIFFTTLISIIQSITILIFIYCQQNTAYSLQQDLMIFIIITLLTIIVSHLSTSLAFLLPGHIEFLGFTLLVNLPSLFASTALAPIALMPKWLQILVCINPMTYAIEVARNIMIQHTLQLNMKIIETDYISIHLHESIFLFTLFNLTNIVISKYIIQYKYQ